MQRHTQLLNRCTNTLKLRLFTTSSLRLDSSDLTYETRAKEIESNSNLGIDTYYPRISSIRQKNSNGPVIRIPIFRQKFDQTDFTSFANNRIDKDFIIEGRILSIRKAGKGMYFFDLEQDNTRLQVMATNKLMEMDVDEFNQLHGWFKPGDYISCIGYASRTKTGELTLKANKSIELLTPCLLKMPNKLIDKGIINNNRVLNYLVNPDSKQPIIIKSKIIQCIRQFLLQRDFLEVQTPILSNEGTGANATPFKTKFKDADVQLRVAPELWLKKLVIGGFDKVFEVGNNFRNEGIDQTHNPEFTSCEFYQAYTSLDELMMMTEDLLKGIFKTFDVNSSTEAEFPKYEFLPTLEKVTGVPLGDLSFDGILKYYRRLDLQIPQDPNPTSLLNNLSEIFLESLSVSKHPNTPVFIYNQPEILSPLAKSTNINNIPVSSRFELFINGKEFVNAYEEENDPQQQFTKFKQQQANKVEFNDDEMLIPDWQYVQTMKLGLPPTGGWGIGIDRLAMFISGVERIDQVLPFGNLRDVLKQ